MNTNGVTRLQTNVDCVQRAFQVVAGYGAPRFHLSAAVKADGINADAPRDHRRDVFDAEIIKPKIADLIRSAACTASAPL